MEFNSQDVKEYLSQQSVGRVDDFGQTYLGHISANNSYGLEDMDVAIRVSKTRSGDQDESFRLQFENELKLRSLQHENIIGLLGFSETKENFYLVYKMFQAKPLSELIDSLTWELVLKILKGILSGLTFLHTHPEGPFVHSNICLSNILVSTKDFVPKLVDFRFCARKGQRTINNNPKQGGVAAVQTDVFAFGLVALQLIAKDGRTAFAVEEGLSLSVHHILDLYLPLFREKRNLIHSSYGQEKKSRKLIELIFDCLKKDSELDLKTFQNELKLLSLTKQC